jgi:hypothetical protein
VFWGDRDLAPFVTLSQDRDTAVGSTVPLDYYLIRADGEDAGAALGSAPLHYPRQPGWSTAVIIMTVAPPSDRHPEAPRQVCLYIGDERCGTYPVKDGASIVLEV